jgi:8-oxo-dGTP diphosphatase
MANAFESGERRVIPAVLVYLRHQGRILMVHRNGRPGDYHSGKWNGLGGKLELDESPREAAAREIFEESGVRLPPERYEPLGVLQFPNFKAHKSEDWIAFLFGAELTDEEAARPLVPSDEGELHWVPEADVPALNLWAGDREFIGHVLARRPVLATIWYDGQDVRKHEVRGIGGPIGRSG